MGDLRFNEWQAVDGTPVLRFNAGELQVWDGAAWAEPASGTEIQSGLSGGDSVVSYADPDGQNWTAHIFTSSGTLTVTEPGLLDTLCVGGGSNRVVYSGRVSYGGGGAVRWGYQNYDEVGDYPIVIGGNTSVSKPGGGYVIASGAGGRVFHNIDYKAYALPGIGGGGSQGGIGINASGQTGGGAGGTVYGSNQWDGIDLYYEGSTLEYGKGGHNSTNTAAGVGAGAGSGTSTEGPRSGIVVVRYKVEV